MKDLNTCCTLEVTRSKQTSVFYPLVEFVRFLWENTLCCVWKWKNNFGKFHKKIDKNKICGNCHLLHPVINNFLVFIMSSLNLHTSSL